MFLSVVQLIHTLYVINFSFQLKNGKGLGLGFLQIIADVNHCQIFFFFFEKESIILLSEERQWSDSP